MLNFQPLAAAAIYDAFLPGAAGGATVYDSSAGWGGRLLGALCSGRVGAYVGCEPNSQTFAGLERMRDFIDGAQGAGGRKRLRVDIRRTGSEDFKPAPDSVDVAFTSPPYFSLEHYSGEATQSHVRFPEFPAWVRGFLAPTMANTARALKSGAHMLVNIANNKMFTDAGVDMEAAVCAEAAALGMEQLPMLRLLKMDGAAEGGEPIFVFRKPRG